MNSPFDRIEIIADRAAERYRGTLRIMRNQEAGALAQVGAFRANGVRALRKSLEQVGDTYLAFEEGHIVEGLNEMHTLASEEAEKQIASTRERLPESFMDPFYDFAIDEIEAQTVRDAAQVMKFHRKRGVDAQMRSMSRGISMDAAIMEIRLESMNDTVNLWFTDRAGRRIASQKHIRRFYRALMRDGYMSALASSLALRGAVSARIVHPDPRATGFGEVVRLDGAKPNLLSFENVFHPNSQASLMAESTFKEAYA